MELAFPIGTPPTIVRAGLSLHGYRRREAFVMHDVWGVHLYLYAGLLRVGDAEHTFTNGMLSITPPDRRLEWSFPDHAPHYYAHLRVDRDCEITPVPVVLGPLTWLEEAVETFEYVGGHHVTHPTAARARLWALLWRAIDGDDGRPSASTLPATIQIAVGIIEQSLSERIVISHLARRVGVSHNHLITLFRAAFGKTVIAYIRERRCRLASFLLRSTSLSIKSIAQEVGIPDLQRFNKTIRSFFGVSPRFLRQKLVHDQTESFEQKMPAASSHDSKKRI